MLLRVPVSMLPKDRTQMALPRCHSQAMPTTVLHRSPCLRIPRHQPCWPVLIAQTSRPSAISINTSRLTMLYELSEHICCIGTQGERAATERKRHDRPRKCDECSQSFAFNRDLQRHITSKHRASTSETQYFCPHPNCDRAENGRRGGFPRKDTLKRHLVTHQKRVGAR